MSNTSYGNKLCPTLDTRAFEAVGSRMMSGVNVTDLRMCPSTFHIQWLGIALKTGWVQAVVTISELHNAADCVAYSKIVVSCEILERLHQSPLHVTGFGCLNGSVDKTFSTRYGMEQELCRQQTAIKAVSDESLGWWFAGFLGEVRERTILETIRNTMPSNDLLADASHHLRNVNHRTYGCLKVW
jgi:hypothetical protein